MSPVLANIYLHYVLDLWFEKVAKKQQTGEAEVIRYSDDFIIGVQKREEAKGIMELLKKRLAKFGLQVSEEKTKIIEFGRFAAINQRKRGEGKPKTFDFLGMTHYCTRTRDGRYKLGVKTSKKSMKGSIQKMNQWLKGMRNMYKLEAIWERLKVKMQGHYNYYGISGNFENIKAFERETIGLAYKWLNRRSQKQSFTWQNFNRYLEVHPLPRARLTYQIYNTW